MTRPDETFAKACEAFTPGLRLHCYRMLGTTSECDDVLQEVRLRAWRAREGLADPARMGGWLYRIATHACIDALHARPRRGLSSDLFPAARDVEVELPPAVEASWLEPAPTAWLDGVPSDPAAAVSQREAIGLAFVAALHALTPKERAALLLRDVVGLSAEETAAALAVTVASVNTALHRARTAVRERSDEASVPVEAVDPELLGRYLRAWESEDVELLVALLREDVVSTMPPRPFWVDGRDANARFYRHMFRADSWRLPVRLVPTSANAAPALAFYRQRKPGEPFVLRAIQVAAVRDGRMRRLDHFMQPGCFPAFGLPGTLR